MLSNIFQQFGFWWATTGWFSFTGAFIVSFIIMIALGAPFIRFMKRFQQPIQKDGPTSHHEKAGTPTMGGLLLLFAIFVGALSFTWWRDPIPWIPLIALLIFGIIGFVDDYAKVKRKSSESSAAIMSEKTRLAIGAVAAITLAFLIDRVMPAPVPELSIWMPGFNTFIYVGVLYFVWSFFVIAGSANAANITDGLDGMLGKILLPVLAVLFLSVYGASHFGFLDGTVFLPEAMGLYPVIGATIGAVLGFLWWNAKPAQIFMGDTGSLALGAMLGTIALILKAEIVFGIAAAMMVIILLSSFIQMAVFKATKRRKSGGIRVFRMAPLHHHLELLGWAETKIVERFFIISILFSALAMAVLKI
ncbi:MAG: phospho-N-acetylmuramoyl-pentapeptide-transferase [Alphaproteobacteria bacterium]|nr:phospho-N-acetylmuramoyl-pentapeptide-transferase [Alphaproteobacteria bacterium]